MNVKIDRLTADAVIVIFAIGIGLLTYFTPVTAEDIIFSRSNRAFLEGEVASADFRAAFNDVIYNYETTNGRLGDKFPILFLSLLPGWVFAVANAMASLLLAKGIIRLSVDHHNKRSGVWAAMFAIAGLLAFFPWHDQMFMVSYSLNYVWAAAIAVWLMWLYLNKTILLRLNGWKMSTVVLLSFFAGWWHEMMLMMLGFSMLLVIVFSDRKLRRRRAGILLAMTIGFIAVMISPAQQSRVESDEMMLSIRNILGWHSILPQPKAIVQFLYLFTIMMSAGINNLGLRGVRNFLSSAWAKKSLPSDVELHLVCVSVCVSNLGVLCLFNYGRLSAIGVAVAIIGLLSIASAAYARLTIWLRLSGKIILVFMMMLFAVNMGLSVNLQKRIYDFDERVMEEWKTSDDGVVYADAPSAPLAQFPWQYFINYLYDGEYKLFTISVWYFDRRNPKPFVLVPENLRGVDLSEAESISQSDCIVKFNGHLLWHDIDCLARPCCNSIIGYYPKVYLSVVTSSGEEARVRFVLKTFRSDSVAGNMHLLVPYGHDRISGEFIERADSIAVIETQPVTYRFVNGRLVQDDLAGK